MRKIFTFCVYIFAVIGIVLTAGFFAVKWGLTNTPGVIDEQSDFFQAKSEGGRKDVGREMQTSEDTWSKGEEWQVFTTAVHKDKESLQRAGNETGISPRLLVSLLAVEQLRLFYTNRQIFKEVFAPLKLLGNQSQFSWGVMGLKRETAIATEQNLKNPSSVFYPGAQYEHLLDFKTKDADVERFQRIINENDRYYSYLYSAVFLREIITQWKNKGFSIENRPEILATLFNIGFEHSLPNGNPHVGGAEIAIGNNTYSFGTLAGYIYYSSELLDEFPRNP